MSKLYKGIHVELGRNKSIKDVSGKDSIIQNVNVSYKGKPIINEDYKSENMVVQIFPDINEAVVGNIFLPEEYRGKRLTKEIYQAVADKLDVPLVNSLNRRDRLGEYYNQSDEGSRIWRNKDSFTPRSKQSKDDNSSGNLEKIISGIFVFSFLVGLFLSIGSNNLTGNVIGSSGSFHKLLGMILVLFGISGFFVYRKLG